MAAANRLVATHDHLPLLAKAIAETPAVDADRFQASHTRVTQLLGIPDSLVGLPAVLRALSGSTLPRVRRLRPVLAPELREIRYWARCLRQIPAANGFWETAGFKGSKVRDDSDADGESSETTVIHRPGRGVVGSHPFWVAMGYASETPLKLPAGKPRNRAFRNVQIALLAAYLTPSARGVPHHERLADACALVRRFGGDKHYHALERYEGCCKFEDIYQQAVQHYRDEPYPIGPFAGALAEFLSGALGLGHGPVIGTFRGRARSSPHGHGARTVEASAIYPGYRSYELLTYGLFDARVHGHPVTFGRAEPTSTTARDLEAKGVDPDEYSTSDVPWVERDDLSESSVGAGPTSIRQLPPLQAVYGKARSRAQAQRLAAQRFTTRRERITVPELAHILAALDDAQLELGPLGDPSANTDRLAHEALLLAGLVFATGTSPEAARALRRWPGNPSTLPSDWQLAYEPAAGPASGPTWRRPCLVPDRGPQRDACMYVLSRDRATVSLSDAWGISPRLDALSDGTNVYFQHSLAQSKRAFSRIVVPKLVAAGVAVRWHSLEALADVLPAWLLGMEEGDQLRVALLYARHDALAKVHLFYTAFDPSLLDAWHVQGMMDLRNRLARCDYAARPGGLFAGATKAAVKRVIAGDERILDPGKLKDTTKALLAKIRGLAPASLPDCTRRHNLITAYVGAFLAICTGFRSVRTPIPDLTLIDDDTGFLVLQEKDRLDSSHGRIAWIPPRLREQVDAYLRHLRKLWFELPPTVPKVLLVPATKQRDRSQYGTETFELDLGCTMFFLELTAAGAKPQEFSGMQLKKVVDSVSPSGWPFDNSGRHFLRSILLHRGCPATIINTLMGHSNLGEGAWSPQSALDPFRYRESLQPYLDTLLDDLKFEVLWP